MIKKTYKVNGMHCASCAKMIELELEDYDVSAKCDFANATLQVEFDEEKIKEEQIHKVVKDSGYSLN